MLLLCTMLIVVTLSATFLKDYADVIIERLGEYILEAAFIIMAS